MLYLPSCFVVFLLFQKYDFSMAESNLDGKSRTSEKTHAGNKRYLVYPTPATGAPTKVQLITGLGLPMEVDVSMIVGYVMKFNYVLPYNASYLTHTLDSRYDRSIDRHELIQRDMTAIKGKNNEPGYFQADDQEEETFSLGIPTRWDIYRLIESTLDGFRVSGKGCLLKAVCQVAQVPFENTAHSGIAAELIHVLLTPSTTREKYENLGDQEYHSAEMLGRDNLEKCENLFSECDSNLLEYFTDVIV